MVPWIWGALVNERRKQSFWVKLGSFSWEDHGAFLDTTRCVLQKDLHVQLHCHDMQIFLPQLKHESVVLAQLSKIYPDTLPPCFRGCRQEGIIFHIWWSCLKVQQFCTRIFNLLYSVTGLNIPKHVKTALFSDLSSELPKHLKTLTFFIFLAAKITIAGAWKSPVLVKRKIGYYPLGQTTLI